MASAFSKDQLRKEINSILKGADLEKTSAKEVRLQLQNKLKVDFTSRKKELDKLIMAEVNAMQDSESEEEEEVEEEAVQDDDSDYDKNKRTSSARKRKADSDSEDDYKPTKTASKSKKKKNSSDYDDDDSDEDWKDSKKKKKGKATGFTRPYKLSKDLAELMGKKEMARHEVVKNVWKIIKEKNLYDPKNKQFAICDEPLERIFGVKRFRTFGMMKYLMPHFIK
ncbi:hypothetical protein PVAND_003832 [Polypedilum vanderplanki]|uniref:Upstream activation factor subunit spp27 n=1 Tax=Polypedilum vanderplanki TaxID=319348 RepID=A0A9J6BVS3_POLVA|nr:hypothetical protein PVAND_003832 [Polypedilum vanderplanki]